MFLLGRVAKTGALVKDWPPFFMRDLDSPPNPCSNEYTWYGGQTLINDLQRTVKEKPTGAFELFSQTFTSNLLVWGMCPLLYNPSQLLQSLLYCNWDFCKEEDWRKNNERKILKQTLANQTPRKWRSDEAAAPQKSATLATQAQASRPHIGKGTATVIWVRGGRNACVCLIVVASHTSTGNITGSRTLFGPLFRSPGP